MLGKYKYLLLLIFCAMLIGCHQPNKQKLAIATAANMQFAMSELTQAFTDETGIACEIIISSSGKLTAQIKEGAPFDVFVSANMKYPNELFKSGFTTAAPKIYAHGKLIMWSMADDIQPSIELLSSDKIKHIAIANPKTAPYGIASVEVLQHHEIFEKLKKKIVYGESIAQTNQFTVSQAAEIGFTAMSVVMSSEIKNQGKWFEIDSNIYSPIEQGIVVLKNSKKPEEAKGFYNFLVSKKGKEILVRYGYVINE